MISSLRTMIARRALVIGTVLALGAGGTVTATMFTTVASPSPTSTAKPNSPAATPGHPHTGHGHTRKGLSRRELVKLTAKDTGQTVAQVRDALKAGKTLNEIAGPKAGQVKTDALAALKTRLDKAVANKKMTAAQEGAALAKAGPAIDRAMAAKHVPRPKSPRAPDSTGKPATV